MQLWIEQLVTALAKGGLYANLALALVMTHKSTGQLNFAQGEMAMVSAFIAWSLAAAGLPLWAAIVLALLASAALGALLERFSSRPFRQQPPAVTAAVSVGVFIILNSLAGWIWGYTARPFASPFGEGVVALGDGLRIKWHTLGSMGVSALLLTTMFLFFRFTPVGLAMRGAADNPVSGRLLGVRVDRLRSGGWALAAVVGAVAGILMAPYTFLDPHMMAGPLIFFFAAALLGGVDSPLGAVLGGYCIGLIELLVAEYLPHGNELKTTAALLIIVGVLLLRPQGLLGHAAVKRV